VHSWIFMVRIRVKLITLCQTSTTAPFPGVGTHEIPRILDNSPHTCKRSRPTLTLTVTEGSFESNSSNLKACIASGIIKFSLITYNKGK